MRPNAITERLGRAWAGLPLLLAMTLCVAASGCASLKGLIGGAPAQAQPTSIASPYRAAPATGVVEAWSGPVEEVRNPEPLTMYRVYGGDARQLGAWLSPVKPVSSAQVRADLALPPQNTAQFVSEVTVPAGTLMRRGTAAPAFGQPGGGPQVQLMELIPPASFHEPQPLDPG